MTDKKTCWVISRTEYVGTQCTGFPSETKIIGIFFKKPAIVDIAPYLDPYLSSEMGRAICEANELIFKGQWSARTDLDFDLTNVELERFYPDGIEG